MIKLSLLWQDPLLLARKFLDQQYLALFCSNFNEYKSFLCVSHSEIFKSSEIVELEKRLNKTNHLSILDHWFGYSSGNQDQFKNLDYPVIFTLKYNIIFEFNNLEEYITLYALDNSFIDYALSRYQNKDDVECESFESVIENIKSKSNNSYLKFDELEILSSSNNHIIDLPKANNSLIFQKNKFKFQLGNAIVSKI